MEFGGRPRVEPFEFCGVTRQRGPQILNRPRIGSGEPVVEHVDDAGDALPQRRRPTRGDEHVGTSLCGAVEHRGPESVVSPNWYFTAPQVAPICLAIRLADTAAGSPVASAFNAASSMFSRVASPRRLVR